MAGTSGSCSMLCLHPAGCCPSSLWTAGAENRRDQQTSTERLQGRTILQMATGGEVPAARGPTAQETKRSLQCFLEKRKARRLCYGSSSPYAKQNPHPPPLPLFS